MVSAPPPMTVTFAEDIPRAGIRLVDAWWPGRLLIDGKIIDYAKRGLTRGLTFDQHDDGTFVSPLVARFVLTNATATYREVSRDHVLWKQDRYEFECVACSRDMSDATS